MTLFGWHWLIKLYRFQVYNSITHHLYIVLCVHHTMSGLLPSPFIPPYSPLPPLHPLSFCCLPMRVFFWFFCLIPSPFSLDPDSCQSVPCIYESVSILLINFVKGKTFRARKRKAGRGREKVSENKGIR